jgi:serine/threonine-protein kinase
VHDGQAAVTQTAAVIGTAQYLSPEQARGEQVDARSDVYAAGCVLFELLTGEPPFTGDSPVAVAYQHVREDPKPPSSLNPRVNPALDAIVLKAMSKGAPNRYQSSAEMRTDLVRVLSGQRPLAPMVMTDEDRTTILATGGRGAQSPQRGRHRPAAVVDDYDDYNPYEDEEEERRRKRRKGWLIALLSVLGVALIAVLVWLLSSVLGDEPADNQVSVPNVLNQVLAQAQDDLNQQGFETRVEYKVCEPTPTSEPGKCGPDSIGKVVDTDPKPGTKMNKSDTLLLMVGQEAQKIAVPDLTGKTPDEARAELQQLGLALDEAVEEEEVEDDEQVGKIVSQTPTIGAQVAKGTPIKVTVGKAPEDTSVPNLVGQDFDTAKGNLENLGFTVKREDQSSDKPANQVIDQNPKDGEHEQGTEITLVVSKGDQGGDNDRITVPDLTGLSPTEAENVLRGMGWTGDLNQAAGSTDQPQLLGKIVDQEQGVNAKIDRDEDVGVVVANQLEVGGGR